MENTEGNKMNAFVNDEEIYHKKIEPIAKPQKNIGIDTSNSFLDNIIDAIESSTINTGKINEFTQVSDRRNEVYNLIDSMANDPLMAAALETYAEDATEYNDQGKIVWAESSNPDVLEFVKYLLDTMNVDKYVYSWVHSLCKYGDVYLRLIRESEFDNLLIFSRDKDTKEQLNEAIKFNAYSKNDNYSHYVEMVRNPAQVFELTKFGKTIGYVKTDAKAMDYNTNTNQINTSFTNTYKFDEKDVNLYPPTEFVHGCLEDTSCRTEEEVELFLDRDGEDSKEKTNSMVYSVKRGQSLFYNIFKVWRQLSLLENSVILNRLTKSSIVRIVQIEVGDMPKDSVKKTVRQLKEKIEQKTALDKNLSMSEYNNPGPVENTIYLPTNGGKGAITTEELGGNPEVKSLLDLDYFKNKVWSALRIPKQFMVDTEDAAGFSGGESLAQISSRYAKEIKKIQNTICQMVTDAVNLMCLDKGFSAYVNKFTIRMQAPSTVEEAARRDDMNSRISITSDVMNLVGDIEDPVIKLKILKSQLSNIISNEEVISYLQDAIDKLEKEGVTTDESTEDIDIGGGESSVGGSNEPSFDMESEASDLEGGEEASTEGTEEVSTETNEPEQSGAEELPNPSDLGVDFTNNDIEG